MQHWVEGTRATISRTYKLRNKNAIGGLSRWQWNHMGDHNYNLKYSLWSWEESMIFYELLWPNNVQINETVLFLERIGYQKDFKPFCINSNKRTYYCFRNIQIDALNAQHQDILLILVKVYSNHRLSFLDHLLFVKK